MKDSVTLTAQCLCKAHTFTTEVARSSLPLKATCCHCNSCRHVTGALYSVDAPWPGDGDKIGKSSLKKYTCSKLVTLLFCGTCSSPMFFQMRPENADESDEYGVFTGVLANIEVPNLVEFGHHMYVGDTLDGGASPWLRNPNQNGVPARRWIGRAEKSQEIHGDWPPIASLPAATLKSEVEEVPVRCHCKGVDLVLRLPGQDLQGKPRSELPWFIDPATLKNLATFDVCDSCRLQAGVDIWHWTFSLLRHIGFSPASGSQQRDFPATSLELREAVSMREGRDPRFGTLTLYSSSPHVQRYFCSRCSACVFYCVDSRPDTLDVALGLLEAPSGARAEEVVSWAFGGSMVWQEDVVGGWREGHIGAVVSTAEAWRMERSYPKNWRRAEKEEAERV
ncbi:hypothetical protein DL771_002684 [Monosporascus sp. 5C6A]|nr:hypothetical protein DL771_002684 [Monosporascus sp. 5C6A]